MTTSENSLARAIAGADALRPGTWESVEALALLAVEAQDRALLARAQQAASGLTGVGSWEAVRALALLVRAERHLG